jgi:hypothetical protein
LPFFFGFLAENLILTAELPIDVYDIVYSTPVVRFVFEVSYCDAEPDFFSCEELGLLCI